MNLICKIFGHKPTGTITGFRFLDGAAISYCRNCNTPIVCPPWRASIYLTDIIAKGYSAESHAKRDLEELNTTLKPFDLNGNNIQGFK